MSRVDAFAAALATEAPVFKDAVAPLDAAARAELERSLALFADDLAAPARAYGRFAVDLMRRQRRFERERAYPPKTYDEALAEVYRDDDYMTGQYLPGLLVSHHLWPHHRDHAAFFDAAFVAGMPADAEFVEVGVGTGYYSRRILEQRPHARGIGYDISPAAVAFAKRHLATLGLGDRYELRLAEDVAATDWLVCIEVLEHLEDPLGFLRALREVATGKALITAALNAAHVDHIYLYERPEEVRAQLDAAGFNIEGELVAQAYPPTAPGLPVPAVAAFLVRRR